MDKRTVSGFILIALIMVGWYWLTMPSQKEMALKKHAQDSLNAAQHVTDSLRAAQMAAAKTQQTQLPDSLRTKLLKQDLGAFANSAVGKDSTIYLENEVLKVAVATHGGNLKGATLKKYLKYVYTDSAALDTKEPLQLMADKKNQFEYTIPANNSVGFVRTSALFFTVAAHDDHSVTMRAYIAKDKYIEQRYSLAPGSYYMDYDFTLHGLDSLLNPTASDFRLDWYDNLAKIEKSDKYEKTMSTIYYQQAEGGASHCSCTAGDEKSYDKPVEWVSHVQQFFNSTLITKGQPFKAIKASSTLFDDKNNPDHNLKLLGTNLQLPLEHNKPEQVFKMQWLLAPNDYSVLSSANIGLPKIIHYGWSIFATINRYIVRPLFNGLSSIVPSLGLCIILLTLFVKLLMYPLQYKMIMSSVKMSVLRPVLAELKKKHEGDQSKFAAEQMKIYQSYGVNPLGGCLPSLIQTPIWIALYRFFPASIQFRQESFLWAKDLVSYDDAFHLFGMHFSLFTLLWLISMLAFGWYNSKLMDTSMTQNNPMVKWMPYIFPFMFFFVLNSSASGLTCYMLFSNLFNIGLTVLIKNVIIDENKVREKLELNKANPKQKSGFAKRLEDMMRQQEEIKKQQKKK